MPQPDLLPRTCGHPHRRQSARCLFRVSAALGVCVTLAATVTANGRDILRPGSGAVPSAQGIATGASSGAVATQARTNALDAMARTTRAIQSVQSMQAAARAAAITGPNNLGVNPNNTTQQLRDVTNGLGADGLEIATGATAGSALWQGANLPTQSAAGGQTTVNIKQTSQQAILNWNKFNVGKQTTLNFDQSAGGANSNQWIAFNKITDPSGVPSQILGSIKADGQVYVVNQNGIIFGGSSQVNARALVASSLPINDNLINQGLLNNPDAQFLFTSKSLPTGSKGTPAFTPATPPAGKIGDVTVQAGAQISAPTTSDKVGGRVALIGPNVRNDGSISAPDGQTILAAGQQVGFAAHSTTDASLRGLDVFVGAVDSTSGAATNTGLIDVPRGNVTITGRNVGQMGAVASTTSASTNGRIDLLASYGAVSSPRNTAEDTYPIFKLNSTGQVTLGASSATQILPEYDSTESVIGGSLALNSQLNIQGRAIHFAQDSTVLAPSANVTVSAGVWLPFNSSENRLIFANDNNPANRSQIYVDAGSLINVAGSVGVESSVTKNIVSAQLLGTELADSPLQRTGALRGQTIQVDARRIVTYNGFRYVGTALANVSGYVNLIKSTVAELTTAGGTVVLNAGDSVVMQAGAKIDVSGGSINYQGGMVQTTRLISGGHLYDIADAIPTQTYDGIYTGQFTTTHPKWSVSLTYKNSLSLSGAHYEPSYTYGGNGGTVSISAPSMAIDGQLIGQTISGPRQRDVIAKPATLSFAFQGQDTATAAHLTNPPATPPEIHIQSGGGGTSVDGFTVDGNGTPKPLSEDRKANVFLSPDLLGSSGFGVLSVQNTDGSIVVPAGTKLAAPAGGSITLNAANIRIDGTVSAPGGTLSLTANDISPFAAAQAALSPNPVTILPDIARGHFSLGVTGRLSVAGLIVDDRADLAVANTLPLLTAGGTISIQGFYADLAAGSVLDVSGGVAVNYKGKASYGNGGGIFIEAGREPNAALHSLTGGSLRLGSTLMGYSGAKGGSLGILAPLVQIGGTASNPNALVLSADFFNRGGFTNFTLRGLGIATGTPYEFLPAVSIASGTTVSATAENWLILPYGKTGGNIVLSPRLLDQGFRTPVSLTFSAEGVTGGLGVLTPLVARGDFVLGAGAVIQTDPGGSISIQGDTALILGSVIAPGGTIALSGGRTFKEGVPVFSNSDRAAVTVWLGSQSLLSAAGAVVLKPDIYGHRTGTVLAGGKISVAGNIASETGATLDVSGTSGVLDLSPAEAAYYPSSAGKTLPAAFPTTSSGITKPLYARQVVPTKIDSNGGSITLSGRELFLNDATLLGRAGGTGAQGGSLSVSSGRYSPGTGLTPLDYTLVVTQAGPTLPPGYSAGGTSRIGNLAPLGDFDLAGDGTQVAVLGRGHLTVDKFSGGGFDKLTLAGSVKFSGPVDISAGRELSVADSGILSADAPVSLKAPHVILGQPFHAPYSPQENILPFVIGNSAFPISPLHGAGSLIVTGSLIDVGNLSLQSIGKASLIADSGDIRGNGTLDIAGDLYLRAGQIYPPTAVTFTIAASDYLLGTTSTAGSVTITGSGNRQVPLSAGGQLNIYSSIINQGGILRAPLGTIQLGWDGTGTAPVDLLTRTGVVTTQQLTLAKGSVTSVSGLDAATGASLLIPYGINANGSSWIAPTGVDITASGVPQKSVTISALRITDESGSLIDVRGGGDLYAYRWVQGTGGAGDVLLSSSSYAVIPGYQAGYAPYAPNQPATGGSTSDSDPGYTNNALSVGDRIYLSGGSGLAAGVYTLLPARYALLPGAFLVTPKAGIPAGAFQLKDGSSLVAGYRFNELGAAATGKLTSGRYEVISSTVVRARSKYEDFYGTSFLGRNAQTSGVSSTRLPADGGHIILQATAAMSLDGAIAAQSAFGGRGGIVDISSPVDILIAGSGVTSGSGVLRLDPGVLSAFGAESLLIGGVRQTGNGGTTVSVKTGNLTVDNAGAPLTGTDVILVANQNLTLAPGAQIASAGTLSNPVDTLLFGDAAVPGSGNGTLLRVSSDPGAGIVRAGVDSSTRPAMRIGKNVTLSGSTVILDSTYASDFDPSLVLSGQSIALSSGQISLQLANPGALQTSNGGLVLAGAALQSLQSARTLSLLSYSSIDIYGAGSVGSSSQENLQLHAAEIRGFNTGTVSISAKNILLDNSAGGTSPGAGAGTPAGILSFNAGTIRLGANALAIDRYATVELNALAGVISAATGNLAAQGALTVRTPAFTAAAASKRTITANGAMELLSPSGAAASALASGLGASLTFQGTSLKANTSILLPSGSLTLSATTGDLSVGGLLDVGGTAQTFFDVVKYTDAGQIALSAGGNVTIGTGSTVRVSANPAGGSAGTLAVIAGGSFTLAGNTLSGMAGANGRGGAFSLDVSALPLTGVPAVPSLAPINAALNSGGFSTARSFRVRTGDVVMDGLATAQNFSVSADQGSITVAGTGVIDASGATGGSIVLAANGSVTLNTGAKLSVAAQHFNAAGKGGSISLEAGSSANGNFASVALGSGPQLDIQNGSSLNLSVADATTPSNDAALGHFSGTLHLRAPQIAGNTDLQIQPIAGSIAGASLITMEGYQLFNLQQGGAITNSGGINAAGGNISAGTDVQGSVGANGALFGGNSAAIATRILPTVPANSALVIQPGAEIINTSGNLTLSSDWDLGTFRFGPLGSESTPGNLTLRAAGNLVFLGSLSDGFDLSASSNGLWLAPLMAQNAGVPINAQSWSYRLAAGADFSGVDFHQVQSAANLGGDGSLLLGKSANRLSQGNNGSTAAAVTGFFQVIRTGTGDIDIATGKDVQLLNQFATIYTAGVAVADPTMGGTFDVPVADYTGQTATNGLGRIQQGASPQYSLAGGNVIISAQGNIAHLKSANGDPDSSLQLPNNWLYRRGYVDSVTGKFGNIQRVRVVGDVASTTWWVDFTNFFEGVGALGGGNVTMTAGGNVSNVDAVIPTNARMPGKLTPYHGIADNLAPNAASLVELGGGNLTVRAGNNVDGGVYYIERGQGVISAGNSILTNSTRSPSTANILGLAPLPSETWLPTTLFLGKGGFDVTAKGDLLLGPVANPFLLPSGVNDSFWERAYFSTYAPDDVVNVTSLGGTLTFRTSTNLTDIGPANMLQTWLKKMQLYQGAPTPTASFYQPWLRLNVTNVDAFQIVSGLMPATLKASAFSGDINLAGSLTLSPSATGTVELFAGGAINGLQPAGPGAGSDGLLGTVWGASTVNLSDANPAAIPGIASPFAQESLLISLLTNRGLPASVVLPANVLLASTDQFFNESGATSVVLQTQQTLHGYSLLHANDPEPVRFFATSGDISGITLFSGKAAEIVAGGDISDIGLFIQNNHASDISLAAAGGDILAYSPNSLLRQQAQSSGNGLVAGAAGLPRTGDIQISGPGAIEVLSGRNLDLGLGKGNSDGTGAGITSIGNVRNPNLPFAGADLVIGSGIGGASSLNGSRLDFGSFVSQFLNPATAGTQATRYLPELGRLLGLAGAGDAAVWNAFGKLSPEEQDQKALSIFYLVLRDAGRDHNDSASAGYGSYTAGFSAISALFPGSRWDGDISLSSRNIKTAAGGNISVFAPGGGLSLGTAVLNPPPGLVTEAGGNVSIFTDASVDVGVERIFTLRGGDIMIWSSKGDIAAGASSKTVQSAPPTRVLIDPQSGSVKTDLAGLASGGGIGVLASVAGVAPGSVDLVAPVGAIDAGDAGIRSTGKLNVAATVVLNASNIQASGGSTGTPTVSVSAPNLGSLAATNTSAASTSSAGDAARQAAQNSTPPPQEEPPSIITIEVLGYGGDERE